MKRIQNFISRTWAMVRLRSPRSKRGKIGIGFAALFLFVLAACGGTPAPTASPTQDVASVQTDAARNVLATLTASVPTASATPVNTATSVPSPTPRATNTPRATATPETPALEILDTANATDSLGYAHVFGEIKNHSEQPYNFVQAVVTLYDANDQVLASQFSFTLLDVIPPGAAAPFDVTFLQEVKGAKRYSTQVQGRPGGKMSNHLEITSHKSFVDTLGYFHVTGEVANNGDAPATFVKIVATLYDDKGNITGAAFTYTTLDSIPPGGRSPFDLTALLALEGTSKYQVAVEGK